METAHQLDGSTVPQWGDTLGGRFKFTLHCVLGEACEMIAMLNSSRNLSKNILSVLYQCVCCFEQNSYAGLLVKSMTYRFRKTGLTHSCVTRKPQFLCQSNEHMWILTRLGEEIKGPNLEEHSLKLLKAFIYVSYCSRAHH